MLPYHIHKKQKEVNKFLNSFFEKDIISGIIEEPRTIASNLIQVVPEYFYYEENDLTKYVITWQNQIKKRVLN